MQGSKSCGSSGERGEEDIQREENEGRCCRRNGEELEEGIFRGGKKWEYGKEEYVIKRQEDRRNKEEKEGGVRKGRGEKEEKEEAGRKRQTG